MTDQTNTLPTIQALIGAEALRYEADSITRRDEETTP